MKQHNPRSNAGRRKPLLTFVISSLNEQAQNPCWNDFGRLCARSAVGYDTYINDSLDAVMATK
jgi:hypothetical protein